MTFRYLWNSALQRYSFRGISERRTLAKELKRVLNQAPRPQIPIIIISYNNGSYVRNMVAQLQARGQHVVVLDNASTDADTKQSLRDLAKHHLAGVQVISSPRNFGHMVLFQPDVYEVLPELFACTDPDIELNPAMPANWLDVLADLTAEFGTFKAGPALLLPSDQPLIDSQIRLSKRMPFAFHRTFDIAQWEKRNWRFRLQHPTLQLYGAAIDTTMAVYRKSNYFGEFFDGLRVAGDFGALHLPWFPKLDIMSDAERARYLLENRSATWALRKPQ